MEFEFALTNESDINEIAKWQAEGDYHFYDSEKNDISLEELYNDDAYTLISSFDENEELSGLVQCSLEEDAILFACFFRPDLIGSGLGNDFVTMSINYLVEHLDFTGEKIKIVVENYNRSAISVLERIGFVVDDERTDGQEHWVEMVLYL